MTAQVTTNKMTFADLAKIADDLGHEAGRGVDTQLRFHMQLVEAAFYNAIDLVKDKHGKDKDDATVLVERYVTARSKASLFDAKAPNHQKSISCGRTCIKLGGWPHGGSGEPLRTMNALITMWTKLRAKPETKGKLDDATNTLMKYARVQLKRQTVMDDAELHDLCFKRTPAERTIEQRLETIRKELQKIQVIDPASYIVTAEKEITKRLAEIAKEKKADAQARRAKQTAGKTAGVAAAA